MTIYEFQQQRLDIGLQEVGTPNNKFNLALTKINREIEQAGPS